MERMLALVILCVFLFSGYTPAAGTDFNVFDSLEHFDSTYDESEQTTYISIKHLYDPNDWESGIMDVHFAYTATDNRSLLRIGFTNALQNMEPAIEKMTIQVGNTRYVIQGDGESIIYFTCGQTALDMIDAILQHDGPVKITLSYDKATSSMKLSDMQREALREIYNAYIASGLVAQEHLAVFDTLYPITVQ